MALDLYEEIRKTLLNRWRFWNDVVARACNETPRDEARIARLVAKRDEVGICIQQVATAKRAVTRSINREKKR